MGGPVGNPINGGGGWGLPWSERRRRRVCQIWGQDGPYSGGLARFGPRLFWRIGSLWSPVGGGGGGTPPWSEAAAAAAEGGMRRQR